MSVEIYSADVYENVKKLRKGKDVDNSSDLVYENYQKPQKEEKLNTVVPPKEPASNVTSDGKAAKSSCCCLVGLVILCLLLVVSFSIISWISFELVKQQEELREQRGKVRSLENQTEQLTEERGNFENQTKQLTLENIMLEKEVEQLNVKMKPLEDELKETRRQNNELNRMKEANLASENFPVKDFCPDKKCQPCQKDWIQFQGKCYLFYGDYCETRTKAQEFCRSKAADLVLVDSLQEQEFLKNHIPVYYSCPYNPSFCIVYFIYAAPELLGYWTEQGLMTFQGNLIHNWNTEGYSDQNKFICEREVMLWPK